MAQIRQGTKDDVSATLKLIQELAAYEKAPNEVEVTEAILLEDGFGTDPIFELFVAEEENKIVGIALFYTKYSTWKGRCIYLEDIVVEPSFRGKGIGSQLFEAVMDVATERHAGRMEWQVLDWNEPAIKFYNKYEAQLDPEWLNGRLTRQQLQMRKK